MVLLSSHCFANHKGGCGKSTIIFHSMAQWAEENPEENFLLIDCSLMGDSSVLALGMFKNYKLQTTNNKQQTTNSKTQANRKQETPYANSKQQQTTTNNSK